MTAMQKYALLCSILISGLMTPSIGDTAYMIHLKNGGRLSIAQYWEENQELKFYAGGGTMGIEKNLVKRIERCAIDEAEVYEVKASERRPAEAEQKTEKDLSTQAPPEKVDLKAYQDKMAKLKADLNKTLARLRKATKNKDLEAKNKATEDNRTISAEMWKLTDELEKKTNGKLPADWWEGVGREEPE